MYFPRKSALALAITATFAGGAFTTASAGTASATYNTYATEAIKVGANTGKVVSPSIAYQPNLVVASDTAFTVYVKLSGGATWNAPSSWTSAGSASSAYIATYGSGTSQETASKVGNYSVSQNGKVLAITFNKTSNSHNKSATFNMGKIGNAINLKNASALKKSGGSITANFAFVNGKASMTPTYPSSPRDTAKGEIAASKQAVQIHFVSSGSFVGNSSFNGNQIIQTAGNVINEHKAINVTAAPPLSNVTYKNTNTTNYLTGSNLVDFGAVYLTNTPGKQIDGSNKKYTVSNIKTIKASISGNFLTNGQEKFGLYSDATCATLDSGTKTKPSSKSTVDLKLAGATATANSPTYGCLKVDHKVSKLKQLPTTQPKIKSLKLLDSNGNVVDTASSKPLYNLKPNGADITLENYVPAAAAPYQTYLRVANNGNVNAPVTVTVHGANGSSLGHGTLGKLSQGQSKTYSASQVEKAAGVNLQSGQRPQIELTAPTNYLDAQAYLKDGNGGFTNMTSNKTSGSYSHYHNPK